MDARYLQNLILNIFNGTSKMDFKTYWTNKTVNSLLEYFIKNKLS